MQSGNIVDFVPSRTEITTHYEEGTTHAVQLHDGSYLNLAKTRPEHDPGNRRAAVNALQESRENGEILTGLIYIDTEEPDFRSMMKIGEKPLNSLTQNELCPGSEELQKINDTLR